MSVAVRQYIPNPLRCFKCQRFGHGTNNCRGTEICAKCGNGDHSDNMCIEQKSFCINCKGEHSASDRKCPKYLEQKEILRIKFTEGISLPEAKRKFETSNGVTKTYASVTKAAVTSRSIETQTPDHCKCEESNKVWKSFLDKLQREKNVKIIVPFASAQAPLKTSSATQVDSTSCTNSTSVNSDHCQKDQNKSRCGQTLSAGSAKGPSSNGPSLPSGGNFVNMKENMDTDSGQSSLDDHKKSKKTIVRPNFSKTK